MSIAEKNVIAGNTNLADPIWKSAELLFGAFRETEYRRVILPFTQLWQRTRLHVARILLDREIQNCATRHTNGRTHVTLVDVPPVPATVPANDAPDGLFGLRKSLFKIMYLNTVLRVIPPDRRSGEPRAASRTWTSPR